MLKTELILGFESFGLNPNIKPLKLPTAKGFSVLLSDNNDFNTAHWKFFFVVSQTPE